MQPWPDSAGLDRDSISASSHPESHKEVPGLSCTLLTTGSASVWSCMSLTVGALPVQYPGDGGTVPPGAHQGQELLNFATTPLFTQFPPPPPPQHHVSLLLPSKLSKAAVLQLYPH